MSAFEKVHGLARDVVLTGSEADEQRVTSGCRQRAMGLGGQDRLVSVVDTGRYFGSTYYFYRCGEHVTFLGGAGRDELIGSREDDVLVGGTGRDSAFGKSGEDSCDAERERSCEL